MFHRYMLRLSNLSDAIGFFFNYVSEELMLAHAGGSIKEDVVWFNLGGTDRLRLGCTSQY